MTASGNLANAPPSNSDHVGHLAREGTTVRQESKVARDVFLRPVLTFMHSYSTLWKMSFEFHACYTTAGSGLFAIKLFIDFRLPQITSV